MEKIPCLNSLFISSQLMPKKTKIKQTKKTTKKPYHTSKPELVFFSYQKCNLPLKVLKKTNSSAGLS